MAMSKAMRRQYLADDTAALVASTPYSFGELQTAADTTVYSKARACYEVVVCHQIPWHEFIEAFGERDHYTEGEIYNWLDGD